MRCAACLPACGRRAPSQRPLCYFFVSFKASLPNEASAPPSPFLLVLYRVSWRPLVPLSSIPPSPRNPHSTPPLQAVPNTNQKNTFCFRPRFLSSSLRGCTGSLHCPSYLCPPQHQQQQPEPFPPLCGSSAALAPSANRAPQPPSLGGGGDSRPLLPALRMCVHNKCSQATVCLCPPHHFCSALPDRPPPIPDASSLPLLAIRRVSCPHPPQSGRPAVCLPPLLCAHQPQILSTSPPLAARGAPSSLWGPVSCLPEPPFGVRSCPAISSTDTQICACPIHTPTPTHLPLLVCFVYLAPPFVSSVSGSGLTPRQQTHQQPPHRNIRQRMGEAGKTPPPC